MTDPLFAPQLRSQPIEYYFYPNSQVPVFCPTMEQFEDFEGLVAAIEPLAQRGGVCKIIPPRAWREQLESKRWREVSEDGFPTMRPLQQYFNGNSGTFHQYNVDFHRKLRLAQFFQKSQEQDYRTPVVKVERKTQTIVYGSESVGIAVDYENGEVQLTEAAAAALRAEIRSESGRAKYRAARSQAMEGSGHGFTKDGRALFVSAREYMENEELERVYWKNLTFNRPLYGADVLGTLFPEPAQFPHWNVRALPGLLRRMRQRVPGVNDPYLYLGMWKATFAWHVEDMDLYSINYIHFGAPKAWFAVPISAHGRFETAMQGVFASEYQKCSQFLRHKAFLLSPRLLAQQGIPCNKVVQRAGEIVLTFPMGYHAGFNHGFNCAESVNFALPRWLELARVAKHCQCVGDSVTIDIQEWFQEDEDDRRLIDRIRTIGAGSEKPQQKRPRGRPRKRKPADCHQEQQVSDNKRAKISAVDPVRRLASLNTPAGVCGACLQPISDGAPVECQQCGLTLHVPCSGLPEDDGRYRCTNCVLDTDEVSCALCAYQNGLLLPVRQGSHAHFLCANFVRQTFFEMPAAGVVTRSAARQQSAVVCGLENVPANVWQMDCEFCKERGLPAFGAVVKCAQKKCLRVFHPMCAAVNDLKLLDWSTCRVFCRAHRPAEKP
ncbi:JmjC-domain-containing protein [Linderina pennispora]|uniref:[histone H3]-trimethyl-L-lysine(9) demethylase n=1 Tax=Linderina pennispora TaxID=61395 RepID=A0A1Y1VZK2_9FUNG|nr:JmjC-domain-containing protein [Linderina pennispora]ORX66446.1 JmjC-domain-containing protein [Linderina pennispora]